MKSELFSSAHTENQSNERYVLQNKKMLRAHINQGTVINAAAGAMVAYQGNVAFNYKGSGSIGNFIKKKMSGEDARLMKVQGQGDVFFARGAEDIFTVQLEGDAISVNSSSILAFDDSLSYDIKMAARVGSMMGGGLFNVHLNGHGFVAMTSDGPPVLLDCSQQLTYVDPQAIVCWSANLQPTIKNDTNLGTFIGRGSGESIQMGFHGPGFVVVQPSERTGPMSGQGGNSGGSGGSLSGAIDLFN